MPAELNALLAERDQARAACEAALAVNALQSLKDRYNGATYHERHAMLENASQVAMNAMGDWRDGLITLAQRESRRAAYFALLELRNSIEKE